MSSSIPLVRASSVIPAALWLSTNRRPAADLLVAAGLPPEPAAMPNLLISFHSLFSFMSAMADIEGPDFSARVATPEALMQLGIPAAVIRSSRTVREALGRVGQAFHKYASHVFFVVNEVPGGMEIAEAIPIVGTAYMHHQSQQHVAAFVSCLGLITQGRPIPAKIWITPHPEYGIGHLTSYLGSDISSSEGRRLRMWIPDSALDLPLPWDPEDVREDVTDNLEAIACSSLSESARILLSSMAKDGNPGLDRLARCAGRSRRTLQRLLAAEGTNFAEMLDSVREQQVLAQLNDRNSSLASIATGAGFRNNSSLTRAVRRWANESPREIRKKAGKDL